MRSRFFALAALACLAAAAPPLGGSCGRTPERPSAPPAVATGERWEGSLTPPPPQGAEVVAEVDDARIYLADVERQARARGISPRQALDELITIELLAAEAVRRGLADDPAAVETRRRERVRRLIETDFVGRFDGPEDVPAADLEAMWKRRDVYLYFNHEEYHSVRYVRVPVSKNASPEENAAARALAEAIWRRAEKERPATDDDFAKLAQAVGAERGQKLESARYSTARTGPAVKEFADAAFSIARIGDVARPVRTAWGWDVLYLYNIIPARKMTFEEAEPELRRRIFEASRRDAFLRWVDAIARRYPTRRDDAALARLAGDAATLTGGGTREAKRPPSSAGAAGPGRAGGTATP